MKGAVIAAKIQRNHAGRLLDRIPDLLESWKLENINGAAPLFSFEETTSLLFSFEDSEPVS
jgi:hypothetical protein